MMGADLKRRLKAQAGRGAAFEAEGFEMQRREPGTQLAKSSK